MGRTTTTGNPPVPLTYTTRRTQYTSDGVLHLIVCGESFTLTQIQAAIGVTGPTGLVGSGPADALQLVDAGAKSWLLKVRIHIREGATLDLTAVTTGDVNLLELKSDVGTVEDADSGIIWIKALNSNLLIENTRVTSFDPATGLPDVTDVGVPGWGGGGGVTPRAYIAARSDVAADRTTTASTSSAQDGIHHGPVLR